VYGREAIEIPCPQATATEAGLKGLHSFMKPGRTSSIAVLAGMSGLEIAATARWIRGSKGRPTLGFAEGPCSAPRSTPAFLISLNSLKDK
jgi:hypothetical protein